MNKSLQEIQTPDFSYFYSLFQSKLKTSPKNFIAGLKVRKLASQSQETLKSLKKISVSKTEEETLLDQSGLFTWFLLKKRKMRDLIPDIEFIKYREICSEMISTLGSCCEAHFGLGKLYAHEANFDTALQHIRIAMGENKNDLTYNRWHSVLNIFRVNSKKRALQAKKVAHSNFYSAFLKSKNSGIEVLWALMELSSSEYLKIGIEIESPSHYAACIYDLDKYYGCLAWSSIFLSSGESQKGELALKELIEQYPKRPESYLKLWNFYYNTSKQYQNSLEIAEKAYVNITRNSEYSVIISLNYARSLYKTQKVRNCLELLQLEYTKHSLFTILLYHYGRFCIKSKDLHFLGSAIGALEECLNTTSESRHGQIYYWLSKAYLLSDEKIEAFICAKKSVPLLSSCIDKLEPSDKDYESLLNHKINELKDTMKELHIHLISIDLLERILEEPPLKLEECKLYCAAVKDFDVIEGSIYEAKMWWKGENMKKAKEILYSKLNFTRVKMKVYFLLVEILESEGNYEEMLVVSKEMVKKCRSPMIPVQTWIKANMIYAQCLIVHKKFNEALFVYRSLAQVQPIPYIPDVRYTRELQRASCKEDLESVASKLNNQTGRFDRFSYLSSNLSDFEIQRSKLVCSKQIFATIFPCFEEESENFSETFSTDKSDSELIGSRAPEPLAKLRFSSIPCGDSANIGFSVTTSYTFLYKIGKTCAKYKINTEEGLFALHDFLNTHHYWTREGIEIHEELKVKAKYWLGILYYQSGQHSLAEEVFRDILSMLFQLGRTKMSNEVLKILNNGRLS